MARTGERVLIVSSIAEGLGHEPTAMDPEGAACRIVPSAESDRGHHRRRARIIEALAKRWP